jgi:hypothetical protein
VAAARATFVALESWLIRRSDRSHSAFALAAVRDAI